MCCYLLQFRVVIFLTTPMLQHTIQTTTWSSLSSREMISARREESKYTGLIKTQTCRNTNVILDVVHLCREEAIDTSNQHIASPHCL